MDLLGKTVNKSLAAYGIPHWPEPSQRSVKRSYEWEIIDAPLPDRDELPAPELLLLQ